jgi:hypothetical protein
MAEAVLVQDSSQLAQADTDEPLPALAEVIILKRKYL